jgi:hypothetical protein
VVILILAWIAECLILILAFATVLTPWLMFRIENR